MEKAHRLIVLRMLKDGQNHKTIKDVMAASYSIIWRVRRKWGDRERKFREQSRPAPPPEGIAEAKEAVEKEPRTTINQLSQAFGKTRMTMRGILGYDLGKRSCRRIRRLHLTARTQKKRKDWCKKLLNRLKSEDAGRTLLFSDEKHWTLDAYSSRQNGGLECDKSDQNNAPVNLRNVGTVQTSCLDALWPQMAKLGSRSGVSQPRQWSRILQAPGGKSATVD